MSREPAAPPDGAELRDTAKLWDKGGRLDPVVERFTVGDDRRHDRKLLKADAVASLAHADMLGAIGVLAAGELAALREALQEALAEIDAGRLRIEDDQEDGHSALERFLTRRAGGAGKKIHTGRSRNDQVIAALRLYTREWLLDFRAAVAGLAGALLDFAGDHERTPMAGRTHMQPAMPSTVGLWAAAFAEALIDDADLIACAYRRNDRSPLGAAAGYGAPLPVDRAMVAAALGFAGVQNNVLYVNTSRGALEAQVVEAAGRVCGTLARLAADLLLFTMPEIGYFRLPEELTTGSSIMPQKRNPDILELVRAKAAFVDGQAAVIRSIVHHLPSGYHRDLQQTKGPFLNALEEAAGSVTVMRLAVPRLAVDHGRLRAGCTPELMATDRAYALVAQGVAFRDAYRQIGAELSTAGSGGRLHDGAALDAALAKDYPGAPGNLALDGARRELRQVRGAVERDRAAVTGALVRLAGPAAARLTGARPAENGPEAADGR